MSDGCSKSHLEMVRLVLFRLVSDKFLYMHRKRMRFLIDMYVSWRLNMPWLWNFYCCAYRIIHDCAFSPKSEINTHPFFFFSFFFLCLLDDLPS